MGLYLGPFSGHAVGGNPPPSASDSDAGPRAEVDTVNRSPLRLLRTTMNNHKPKFMRVVPPGQYRGSLAPPYAWDPKERDDWRYEAEFSTQPLPPKPPASLEGPTRHPARRGDTRRLPKPMDPRRARINAINQELNQLRMEVKQLLARQKAAVAQGKQQVAATAKQFAPNPEGAPMEELSRSSLRLLEAEDDDYTPFGIPRRTGDAPRPGWHRNPHDSPLPMPTRSELKSAAQMRDLRQRGIPTGLRNQPPKASAELIAIHKELQQKRAQIHQLTQELQQLRQQMKMQHESVRLSSNNLRRLGLLLQ